MLTPAFAAPAKNLLPDGLAGEPALSAKRLTGSLTVGYDSNYVGRGLVISHSVAEGDGSEFVALKTNYDINREKYWSFDSTVLYKAVSSGHTLYGPKPYAVAHIKHKNIENEFAVITGVRYTGKRAHVAFGHKFVHGGLLGAMAKHFRRQGASVVNEAYLTPSVTPFKWLEAGVTVSYSFEGIQGWWYEPYVTVKAPVFGEPQTANSMLALLTLGMSATSNYFHPESQGACANGPQAWWVKLATPYFPSKHFMITPSVSFNWLGTGGQKANSIAAFKKIDRNYVPFRNFGVVAGVSCSYIF